MTGKLAYSPTFAVSSPLIDACKTVMHIQTLYFIFLKLIIFNWRTIALQHCAGFCHTSTWISHRYTYVPSLLNLPPTSQPSHPSRLPQSPELSSLRHTANFYGLSNFTSGSAYVSVLLSQFVPPSPSPTGSTSLHFHCCPANRFISTTFQDSIYMCYYTILNQAGCGILIHIIT